MEGQWRSFKGTNTTKDTWRYGCRYLDQTSDSLAFLGELSWPPRLYTCSFCKREFRSAQALGGHMNVHRRDRARLRESPPPREPLASVDQNPNHEFRIPNLNYPPEPLPLSSSLVLPEKSTPPLSEFCKEGGGGNLVKKNRTTLVRLELEIGICSNGDAEAEEELDLELRLGYA